MCEMYIGRGGGGAHKSETWGKESKDLEGLDTKGLERLDTKNWRDWTKIWRDWTQKKVYTKRVLLLSSSVVCLQSVQV